jgi:hypothetical protein
MMKLEAWSLAVSGSVLAMITTPGNIVGLPVGIWALVTLLRPEVRAAFRQRMPSRKEHPGPGTPESRISQKAIWGTVLTALSFCVILPILLLIVAYFAARRGGGIPTIGLGVLEIVVFFVMSFLPGVAGTILGALAIGDLRRQPDRLHGRALALFAALGWPLLAFNLILIFTARFAAILPFVTTFAFLPALILVSVCFNWWLTSAAWRRVNGFPGVGHSLLPEQKRRLRRTVWPVTAAMVLPLLILTTAWFAHSASRAPSGHLSETANSTTSPTLSLTVIAVEVREETSPPGYWLAIDFAEETDFDCELFVRTARGNPDEIPVTRKTYYLKDDPGRPPVKHQRVEWKLPAELDHDARLALRETVGSQFLHQTITLRPGDERLVLNVPLKNGGTLAGYLGAKFKGNAPR